MSARPKIVKHSFGQCLPLPMAQDANIKHGIDGTDWKYNKDGIWGNCTFFPAVSPDGKSGCLVMIYYGSNPIMIGEPGYPASDPKYYRGGWAGEEADYRALPNGVKTNAYIYNIDMERVYRILLGLKFSSDIGYITFIATENHTIINGQSWELALYACAAGMNPQAYTGGLIDSEGYSLANLAAKVEIASRANRILYAPKDQVPDSDGTMTTLQTAPKFLPGTRAPQDIVLFYNVADLVLSQYSYVLSRVKEMKSLSRELTNKAAEAPPINGDTMKQMADNMYARFIEDPRIAPVVGTIPAWIKPDILFTRERGFEDSLGEEITADMENRYRKGAATAANLFSAAKLARKSYYLEDRTTFFKRYDSLLRSFFMVTSVIKSDEFPLGNSNSATSNPVKMAVAERDNNPVLGRVVPPPPQKRTRSAVAVDAQEASRIAKAANEARKQTTLEALRQMYQRPSN